MFLGMEWYWWLVIVIVFVVMLPLKIKCMKWWGRRGQEKRNHQRGKWGEEE